MVTQRIDQFTDGAWLLLLSITLIVLFHRVLQLLVALALDALPPRFFDVKANATMERNINLVRGAIMVVVGISAATISLPDSWVQSVISALSVGIGFALRDALAETLYGIQSVDLYHSTFAVHAKLPSTRRDSEEAQRKQTLYRIKPHSIRALSCVIENVDEGVERALQYRVPWSYLHTRIVRIVA